MLKLQEVCILRFVGNARLSLRNFLLGLAVGGISGGIVLQEALVAPYGVGHVEQETTTVDQQVLVLRMNVNQTRAQFLDHRQ